MRQTIRRQLGAHAASLAFGLALVLGLAMTGAVFMAERRSQVVEFEHSADQAVDRVLSRLDRHVILLRATKGLFDAAENGVSHDKFSRFVGSVDIMSELKGIQGIGFARMMPAGTEAQAAAEVATHYGQTVAVRPETSLPLRTPIVLLEPPDQRNLAALGYDMYAEPVRRAAMDKAIATDRPQITAPVELVQEITDEKQAGFLVYLPLDNPRLPRMGGSPVAGFIYAPFRAGDLIRTAMEDGEALPVALKVLDVDANRAIVHADPGIEAADGLKTTRLIEVMGRNWAFQLRDTSTVPLLRRHYGSLLLGVISLMFASAAALAITARQQEAAQARAVAAASAREVEYRGMLLQEMKHRIKNHIARIQSIARQSARGATDVKAFTEAFDARLQAMAAVQEILAGNASAEGDLGAILRKELQQGLDQDTIAPLLDGPEVRLDERQSHALALVFHELVTNAMKYGGLSPSGQGLTIDWHVDHSTAPPQLVIDWQERFANGDRSAGAGKGFGSRLIEASLRGELAGQIERSFHPDGLTILLRFPLAPCAGI